MNSDQEGGGSDNSDYDDSGNDGEVDRIEDLTFIIRVAENVSIEHESVHLEADVINSSDLPTHSTFDLTLPATHSYLGDNLEEVRGRTILDDGIHINLPILVKRSIVLFPGQTFPMTVFSSNVIHMLQKCIENNRTFGIVCMGNEEMLSIGTTAEIFEFKEKGEGHGFRIKAKGRQRFKIISIEQNHDIILANVKILPEILLPPPLFQQRLVSLDHIRMTPTNEEETRKQELVERRDAVVTQWPFWIYRCYDMKRLSTRVRQYLQYIEIQGSNIPEDPTDLSFWVAQNLPLNDRERIILLNYNCAIPRLQREIRYLLKDRYFACCHCNQFIGKQSDIFPMSKEGMQSTYCNPSGVVHDTVTLFNARGLVLDQAEPSTEYSWFPGYAWVIASCSNCRIHMGWRFTAVHDGLRPAAFWGLTRRSLRSNKLPMKREQYYMEDESSDEILS